MFKWFNKNSDEPKKLEKELEKIEIIDLGTYETQENGDIKIKVKKTNTLYFYYTYIGDIIIPKSSIISLTANSIIFKDYDYYFNFEPEYNYPIFTSYHKSIENKESLIKYKKTQIKTYNYISESEGWNLEKIDVIGTKIECEQTPLEIFKEHFKFEYKLIETEKEFNEYIASSLDCNTWCRKKLLTKMKELNFGSGFINQFADLVGNDLNKYKAMIELAEEVKDKELLMYLYTYKFGKKN